MENDTATNTDTSIETNDTTTRLSEVSEESRLGVAGTGLRSDEAGPQYTKEAADALTAAYALTAEPSPDSASSEQGTSDPENSTSSDDYTLTFPETFAEHPEAQAFNTILAPIAKESGIDGTAFGKLFAEAYTAITEAQQRAEWQNRFQQDSDLKKDWGADYEANMATARSHIAFLKERAGLSDDDLAVFASPKGMRALYAMATAHAAPPAAGLDANTITEQTWAKAVMQPDHADHDAFVNPMNPRYKEVNQRWLRANGQ